MALITHAYFDEGDFSKVSLLEDTYHHLNSVLLQNDLSTQTFVGMLLQKCFVTLKDYFIISVQVYRLEILFYNGGIKRYFYLSCCF